MQDRQNKIKTLKINICVGIIAIIVGFFLSEISMRIAGKIMHIDFTLYMKELKNSNRLPDEMYIHDKLGYRLRPNTQVLATTSDFSVIYKINSQGLRDKEHNFTKPKSTTRILAFGDSFTFGEGVPYGERFTDITGKHFSNLEIINFGVPGYGLDNILLTFAREGLKYSPDYVILFLNNVMLERYSTNIIKNNSIDIEKYIYRAPMGGASTAYINKKDNFFTFGNRNSIFSQSYLLSYLRYQLALLSLKQKLREYDKEIWAKITTKKTRDKESKTPQGLPHTKETVVISGSAQDYSIANNIPERSKLIIKQFNEICRVHKIKLILINSVNFGRIDYLNSIDNSITYYDLNDALNAESRKYRLQFVYDQHYNPKTNKFIAQELIEILEETVLNNKKG